MLSAEKSLRVLCTTFPIYQITQNVAQGRKEVSVDLMLPTQLGCPHDYVLTPQDMNKIAQADVLVVNGLGMEDFLGAPLRRANDKIVVIDSSKGLQDILRYSQESESDRKHKDSQDQSQHDSEAKRDNNHLVNPHLFASPRMAAKLAMNIAEELSKIDPDGAAVYMKNAEEYDKKMNTLADEFAALVSTLKNNRIITQHGVFDYLARDAGLEIVAVLQSHAGQEPSASEMLEIVSIIKEKQAGAIFTEPQYPDKVGKAIAKEAGIPTAILDPGASGSEDAGLDYYEKVMKKNMETLKKTLGTK